ncbi:MAG: hypothetical protein JJW00_01705 [Sulfurimonas sp.]|nr:hypothetical protein [Sulfurimonas sp.]
MKTLRYLSIFFLLLSSSIYASKDLDDSLSQDHTYEKDAQAKDGLDLGNGWKLFGDIRAGWVGYDYDNAPDGIDSNGNITPTSSSKNKGHLDSKGFYIMPKISVESPYYKGLMAKITVGGVSDLDINDEKYESRTFVYDPKKRKSYAIVQEAFLFYENSNNKVLIGREELTTPMIDTDDWYMFANSFELARYQNNSLDNIVFNLGYFHKMAGTWDSGADNSQGLDKTSFNSMTDVSYIDEIDKTAIGDQGIYFVSMQYNDKKNHNIQVWNYYGEDTYNTLFIQYDYTNKNNIFSYDAGVQIINFKETGFLATNEANTNIDYSLYQARFDGKFDIGIDFATGIAKYTDGEGQGATLGAFGGYPYFANGMIFHFFEAGSLQNASSYKAQVGYDLAKIGLENTWIGYRYTFFDLDSKYSKSTTGEDQNAMSLNGIRISYTAPKGGYFTGTYEHVNLDHEPNTYALRLIGGYKF